MSRVVTMGQKRIEVRKHKKTERKFLLFMTAMFFFLISIFLAVTGLTDLFASPLVQAREYGQILSSGVDIDMPFGYWASITERVLTVHAWDGSRVSYGTDGVWLNEYSNPIVMLLIVVIAAFILAKLFVKIVPLEKVEKLLDRISG